MRAIESHFRAACEACEIDLQEAKDAFTDARLDKLRRYRTMMAIRRRIVDWMSKNPMKGLGIAPSDVEIAEYVGMSRWSIRYHVSKSEAQHDPR